MNISLVFDAQGAHLDLRADTQREMALLGAFIGDAENVTAQASLVVAVEGHYSRHLAKSASIRIHTPAPITVRAVDLAP